LQLDGGSAQEIRVPYGKTKISGIGDVYHVHRNHFEWKKGLEKGTGTLYLTTIFSQGNFYKKDRKGRN